MCVLGKKGVRCCPFWARKVSYFKFRMSKATNQKTKNLKVEMNTMEVRPVTENEKSKEESESNSNLEFDFNLDLKMPEDIPDIPEDIPSPPQELLEECIAIMDLYELPPPEVPKCPETNEKSWD